VIGTLLKAVPWLALAVALIGGGWWVRDLQAERDTLAAQVEGLQGSADAWAEAYAESEADHQAVLDALARAHRQTAALIERRATLLEDLRHAPDLDDSSACCRR